MVPWGGLYQPVWLGLGALALDLLVAITVTSLLRTRLPHAAWRLVHWASYLAWGIAVVHGIGIGTDSDATWSVMITAGLRRGRRAGARRADRWDRAEGGARMRASVDEGPRLLAHLADGPGLARHRLRHPAPARVTVEQLARAAEAADLRGRGGAGFPFATKLRTAARRGAVVVVNLSEGEPASHKDEVLAMRRPHLILDGAVLAARALGARRIHLVLPGDKPLVSTRMTVALAEREGADKVEWRIDTADAGFVSGQARAVIELMSGRANLPVTAWTPEAVSGHRGRPTLLSNAETFAQLASIWAHGPDPATMLITRAGDTPAAKVVEVALGRRGAPC